MTARIIPLTSLAKINANKRKTDAQSPIPWKMSRSPCGDSYVVHAADGEFVCEASPLNAARIVAAVNFTEIKNRKWFGPQRDNPRRETTSRFAPNVAMADPDDIDACTEVYEDRK